MDTPEDFQVFFAESDRGSVLVMAEELNSCLLDYHKNYFKYQADASGRLVSEVVEWPGPLSSFATRTRLAYLYGLINKDTFEDLERFRKIRNQAAHSTKQFSLSAVVDKILEIKAPDRIVERGSDIEEDQGAVIEAITQNSDELRRAFASTVTALGGEIVHAHTEFLERMVTVGKAKRLKR